MKSGRPSTSIIVWYPLAISRFWKIRMNSLAKKGIVPFLVWRVWTGLCQYCCMRWCGKFLRMGGHRASRCPAMMSGSGTFSHKLGYLTEPQSRWSFWHQGVDWYLLPLYLFKRNIKGWNNVNRVIGFPVRQGNANIVNNGPAVVWGGSRNVHGSQSLRR